jgi:microcystin-dependent protein
MSDPFIGEIRMFGGNFAPAGWAMCQGQLLPISENDALFALIGTTYGGDGQETFALPDLQGRAPVHMGTGPGGVTFQIGEKAGTETETLTTQQLPLHNHAVLGSAANGGTTSPIQNVPATAAEVTVFAYGVDNPPDVLSSQSITPVGGNQPHENLQPYLTISFIISLFGIFPHQ